MDRLLLLLIPLLILIGLFIPLFKYLSLLFNGFTADFPIINKIVEMNTLYCQPNETPKSNCNSQHNANAQESLNTFSHDKNLNDQINKNIQVDNKRNSPITDVSAITNTNTNTLRSKVMLIDK